MSKKFKSQNFKRYLALALSVFMLCSICNFAVIAEDVATSTFTPSAETEGMMQYFDYEIETIEGTQPKYTSKNGYTPVYTNAELAATTNRYNYIEVPYDKNLNVDSDASNYGGKILGIWGSADGVTAAVGDKALKAEIRSYGNGISVKPNTAYEGGKLYLFSTYIRAAGDNDVTYTYTDDEGVEQTYEGTQRSSLPFAFMPTIGTFDDNLYVYSPTNDNFVKTNSYTEARTDTSLVFTLDNSDTTWQKIDRIFYLEAGGSQSQLGIATTDGNARKNGFNIFMDDTYIGEVFTGINGADSIDVTEVSSASETYTVNIVDSAYESLISSVDWTLADSYRGVSLNDGVLTVTSDVQVSKVTLNATITTIAGTTETLSKEVAISNIITYGGSAGQIAYYDYELDEPTYKNPNASGGAPTTNRDDLAGGAYKFISSPSAYSVIDASGGTNAMLGIYSESLDGVDAVAGDKVVKVRIHDAKGYTQLSNSGLTGGKLYFMSTYVKGTTGGTLSSKSLKFAEKANTAGALNVYSTSAGAFVDPNTDATLNVSLTSTDTAWTKVDRVFYVPETVDSISLGLFNPTNNSTAQTFDYFMDETYFGELFTMSGADSINVKGKDSETATYSVDVVDSNYESLISSVDWTLADSYRGVSLNDGVLTVTNEADVASVTLNATITTIAGTTETLTKEISIINPITYGDTDGTLVHYDFEIDSAITYRNDGNGNQTTDRAALASGTYNQLYNPQAYRSFKINTTKGGKVLGIYSNETDKVETISGDKSLKLSIPGSRGFGQSASYTGGKLYFFSTYVRADGNDTAVPHGSAVFAFRPVLNNTTDTTNSAMYVYSPSAGFVDTSTVTAATLTALPADLKIPLTNSATQWQEVKRVFYFEGDATQIVGIGTHDENTSNGLDAYIDEFYIGELFTMSGSDSINVSGKDSVATTYKVDTKSSAFESLAQSTAWSLEGTPEGVSINAETGELTVTSASPSQEVTVKATVTTPAGNEVLTKVVNIYNFATYGDTEGTLYHYDFEITDAITYRNTGNGNQTTDRDALAGAGYGQIYQPAIYRSFQVHTTKDGRMLGVYSNSADGVDVAVGDKALKLAIPGSRGFGANDASYTGGKLYFISTYVKSAGDDTATPHSSAKFVVRPVMTGTSITSGDAMYVYSPSTGFVDTTTVTAATLKALPDDLKVTLDNSTTQWQEVKRVFYFTGDSTQTVGFGTHDDNANNSLDAYIDEFYIGELFTLSGDSKLDVTGKDSETATFSVDVKDADFASLITDTAWSVVDAPEGVSIEDGVLTVTGDVKTQTLTINAVVTTPAGSETLTTTVDVVNAGPSKYVSTQGTLSNIDFEIDNPIYLYNVGQTMLENPTASDYISGIAGLNLWIKQPGLTGEGTNIYQPITANVAHSGTRSILSAQQNWGGYYNVLTYQPNTLYVYSMWANPTADTKNATFRLVDLLGKNNSSLYVYSADLTETGSGNPYSVNGNVSTWELDSANAGKWEKVERVFYSTAAEAVSRQMVMTTGMDHTKYAGGENAPYKYYMDDLYVGRVFTDIDGAAEIAIPESGSVSDSYSVKVINPNYADFNLGTTWAITGNGDGVTLDGDTLTVASTAQPQVVTLTATITTHLGTETLTKEIAIHNNDAIIYATDSDGDKIIDVKANMNFVVEPTANFAEGEYTAVVAVYSSDETTLLDLVKYETVNITETGATISVTIPEDLYIPHIKVKFMLMNNDITPKAIAYTLK